MRNLLSLFVAVLLVGSVTSSLASTFTIEPDDFVNEQPINVSGAQLKSFVFDLEGPVIAFEGSMDHPIVTSTGNKVFGFDRPFANPVGDWGGGGLEEFLITFDKGHDFFSIDLIPTAIGGNVFFLVNEVIPRTYTMGDPNQPTEIHITEELVGNLIQSVRIVPQGTPFYLDNLKYGSLISSVPESGMTLVYLGFGAFALLSSRKKECYQTT